MGNSIWKFPLKILDEQVIQMPKNARILSLQLQNTSPCIWAFVTPENELEDRFIKMFGTGHVIKGDTENLLFIGTFQLPRLVFHVFEEIA